MTKTANQSLMEILAQRAVGTPKSPVGIFHFPCGHLVDPANPATSALWTEFEVREIGGAEEDILSSEEMPPFKKLSELIRRTVRRVGPEQDPSKINAIVSSLTATDRVFALYALRRVSLGDLYPFEAECANPNCTDAKGHRTKAIYEVNLSTVEVKPALDPRQRAYTIPVPSGKEVSFHCMTGADEGRIARYTENKATLQHAARIDRVGDTVLPTHPDRVDTAVVTFLQTELSAPDRDTLREAYAVVEGGLDTSIEITCKACRRTFKKEMDLQSGFFFPSATRKRSNETSSG